MTIKYYLNSLNTNRKEHKTTICFIHEKRGKLIIALKSYIARFIILELYGAFHKAKSFSLISLSDPKNSLFKSSYSKSKSKSGISMLFEVSDWFSLYNLILTFRSRNILNSYIFLFVRKFMTAIRHKRVCFYVYVIEFSLACVS